LLLIPNTLDSDAVSMMLWRYYSLNKLIWQIDLFHIPSAKRLSTVPVVKDVKSGMRWLDIEQRCVS